MKKKTTIDLYFHQFLSKEIFRDRREGRGGAEKKKKRRLQASGLMV